MAARRSRAMNPVTTASRHEDSLLSFSFDHRVIGRQYFALSIASVLVGIFLSALMRIHIVWPSLKLPLLGAILPETYLGYMTIHATMMVFFVLTSAPQGAFANLLLPAQIGSWRMAFPTLNALGFWLTFVSWLVMVASLLASGGAPLSGWTQYPPLSALPNAGPGQALGMDLWLLSIAMFCVASCVSS